jgi:hypothetical protein
MHTRLRVLLSTGIPCALRFRKAVDFKNSGVSAPRECADATVIA